MSKIVPSGNQMWPEDLSFNLVPRFIRARHFTICCGDFPLKLPRKSGSPDSEVSKSCSVENEGVDKSSLSSKSKNFCARKSVLLRGVDPPEILEETHTGIW